MAQPDLRPRLLDRAEILAAAVLFSTGGAAIKATTLSGWEVASLRSGFAAVTLLLLLPAARRRWSWRTALVGLAYAATMILYVGGNKLTTAASTIFLQSTAPLYILLLGPWLLRERARSRDLALMAALAVGLAVTLAGRDPATSTAPDPALGNLLGVGSGFFWALTLLGIRWLGREQGGGAAAAVACGNLIACAVSAPAALPIGPTGPSDWGVVVFLGVVQIAIAYVFLTRGMSRVPALESSLLLLVEPVLNPFWAWLVHGERPGSWALLGGVVILGATAVRTWQERRPRPTAATVSPAESSVPSDRRPG